MGPTLYTPCMPLARQEPVELAYAVLPAGLVILHQLLSDTLDAGSDVAGLTWRALVADPVAGPALRSALTAAAARELTT